MTEEHVHGPDCGHDHLGELSIPPSSRMRRTRMHERHRRLVRETEVRPHDLMLPLFILEGAKNAKRAIASMPGVYQLGLDRTLSECEAALRAGLGGVILFGIPKKKDAEGSEAYNENGVIQVATRAIKQRFPELLVATDVCLCEYTDHGHCGVLSESEPGITIDNDPTVNLLAMEAISHAEAGSDLVAPSDMMDGRVGAIRDALDMNGFENLPIMSYSAKFASSFYGPFRDAAGSTPAFGDRRSHQMDVANGNEAIRAVRRDIEEGADIVMVKPAMPSLDIIRRVSEEFKLPTAAYQVSGEYSMIRAAAANGWIDEGRAIMESLTTIKRAGASIILSYFSLTAAELMHGNK